MSHKDIAISAGVIALLIFSHIASNYSRANASPTGQLLLQGSGLAYGEPVNEQLGSSEQQAINVLLQLGSAQLSYSTEITEGRSGYLNHLTLAGYLAPNATSISLAQGYSIGIYLPYDRKGFTVVAEPTNLDLRPFLIDENQAVTLLSPSIGNDPDEGWAEARMKMISSNQYGRYQYPFTLELLGHTPPLQVRMNQGASNYVLLSLLQTSGNRYYADSTLLYSSYLNAYMVGQLMPRE
jgi:hypothetical protein